MEITEALTIAKSWVGRSHREMDCEQLVVEFHRLLGVEMGGLYAGLFKGLFRTVFDPLPGDVVPICNHRLYVMTHGAIYLGDQEVLHSFEDAGVVILPLTREPWFSRIACERLPNGSFGRRGFLRLRT